MNNFIKTIVSLVDLVLCIELFGVTCNSGKITEDNMKLALEKADKITEDFSNVALYGDSVEIYAQNDPMFDREVKLVDVRINGDYVLRLEYDHNTELFGSQIMEDMSPTKALIIILLFIALWGSFFYFVLFALNTIHFYVYEHKNKKEKDEQKNITMNKI